MQSEARRPGPRHGVLARPMARHGTAAAGPGWPGASRRAGHGPPPRPVARHEYGPIKWSLAVPTDGTARSIGPWAGPHDGGTARPGTAGCGPARHSGPSCRAELHGWGPHHAPWKSCPFPYRPEHTHQSSRREWPPPSSGDRSDGRRSVSRTCLIKKETTHKQVHRVHGLGRPAWEGIKQLQDETRPCIAPWLSMQRMPSPSHPFMPSRLKSSYQLQPVSYAYCFYQILSCLCLIARETESGAVSPSAPGEIVVSIPIPLGVP
nr:unnamed protein product [Digitaria exilis]